MMLAHPQMDTVLDFSSAKVNTLVIEHPGFFRELLMDINSQIQGASGKTVLSCDNTPVDFSKNAELIDSLLSFDICRKSLIAKIVSKLEAEAVRDANYLRTVELIGQIEQFITDLSFDLPCDISCSKINIGGVFRSAGIEIMDDYDNDLEKLLDYMELTRELEREKLFVFVNLRSYYNDDEVAAFLSSAISHEYQMLLIDSVSRAHIPMESRITIDIDLCEF